MQPLISVYLVAAENAVQGSRHLILGIFNGIEIPNQPAEAAVTVSGDLLVFLKEAVDIKRTVYRQVHLAFDEILQGNIQCIKQLPDRFKRFGVFKRNEFAVFQLMVFFAPAVTLQKRQQFLAVHFGREDIKIKQIVIDG